MGLTNSQWVNTITSYGRTKNKLVQEVLDKLKSGELSNTQILRDESDYLYYCY